MICEQSPNMTACGHRITCASGSPGSRETFLKQQVAGSNSLGCYQLTHTRTHLHAWLFLCLQDTRESEFIDLQADGCTSSMKLVISAANKHGFMSCNFGSFVLELDLEDDAKVVLTDNPALQCCQQLAQPGLWEIGFQHIFRHISVHFRACANTHECSSACAHTHKMISIRLPIKYMLIRTCN